MNRQHHFGAKVPRGNIDGNLQALNRRQHIPRRISGNNAKHQRQVALAIKRARMIGLMPFTVTGK